MHQTPRRNRNAIRRCVQFAELFQHGRTERCKVRCLPLTPDQCSANILLQALNGSFKAGCDTFNALAALEKFSVVLSLISSGRARSMFIKDASL